jgi:hypothetical protein
LFNPTDEQAHFDGVEKYSSGFKPQKELPTLSPATVRLISLYGTVEYFTPRVILQAQHEDVPIAQLPAGLREEHYQHWSAFWEAQRNFEAQSPPLYYWIASWWYRLGGKMGIRDWRLAYWVRFLNVVLYAAFVWISYVFVREVYPERDFLCVCVPALLAVMPQDVLYGINRETLSPLIVAAALLFLFRSMRKDGDWYALITGSFLAGLAFLTDVSNWVLFGGVLVVFVLGIKKLVSRHAPLREFAEIGYAAMATTLPPVLWMGRNLLVMGDLTGAKAKIAYLTWTVKPWHAIWQHPMFSREGIGHFLQELTSTYWRGEYYWEGYPLHWRIGDGFYVLSSYLLVGIFAAHLLGSKTCKKDLARLNGLLSLYLLVASILFLTAISLPFDFHLCFYPSRAEPYFASGRVICGTLLPFAVLYVSGFEHLLSRTRQKLHPVIPFALLCIFVTASEALVVFRVFHSPFNFFSLLGHG